MEANVSAQNSAVHAYRFATASSETRPPQLRVGGGTRTPGRAAVVALVFKEEQLPYRGTAELILYYPDGSSKIAVAVFEPPQRFEDLH
jgi:hypothetical protein